mmetsp:Transcript_9673/g.39097  ORF Transcript_9673/g.39097 Transcript_9673/m.39097 type:complete len:214 (+) Transcript_9673:28-669(+)
MLTGQRRCLSPEHRVGFIVLKCRRFPRDVVLAQPVLLRCDRPKELLIVIIIIKAWRRPLSLRFLRDKRCERDSLASQLRGKRSETSSMTATLRIVASLVICPLAEVHHKHDVVAFVRSFNVLTEPVLLHVHHHNPVFGKSAPRSNLSARAARGRPFVEITAYERGRLRAGHYTICYTTRTIAAVNIGLLCRYHAIALQLPATDVGALLPDALV